jgi:predicted AlkP superfamily phosphohydrolase/phosphomutase
MDGAGMKLVKRMADSGHMPHVAELMENGVYAYMIGVMPTLTPPGWTSLTTGTWPGTHKVMDFNIYSPGRRLDDPVWGINTGLCRAEYIWNLAEKAGKIPILVKWEMSWPPTIRKGVQVEGTGPGVSNYHQIAGYHLFVAGKWKPRPIGGYRDSEEVDPSILQEVGAVDPVKLEPASERGWENLPQSALPCLEVELVIHPLKRGRPNMLRGKRGTPKVYFGLIYASGDRGYDRVRICRSRDGDEYIVELQVGKFSEWWLDTFEIDGAPVEGYVRMKLISLSPNADVFELFVPQIWPTEGYTFPEEVAEEIRREIGPFLQNPARDAIGIIDDDTYFELLEYHHECLVKVAKHLAETRPWHLLMVETHAPDYTNHTFLSLADELSGASKEIMARCIRGVERTYESIDRMVGRLMDLMDERTVILLCSDHGGTPNRFRAVRVEEVLEEAGFLVYRKSEKGKKAIDWSRTKAAPVGVSHIFINLKGREPTGIVPPEEYDETRRQIIEALYGYRDPETRRKPFALALTREDVEMLNLKGGLVGDVVYALKPEFDGAHGRQLPTATLGISGQHSTFIMAGAGVRRGGLIKTRVEVVDVMPTVCHLLGIPIPENVEGRVIREALTEP